MGECDSCGVRIQKSAIPLSYDDHLSHLGSQAEHRRILDILVQFGPASVGVLEPFQMQTQDLGCMCDKKLFPSVHVLLAPEVCSMDPWRANLFTFPAVALSLT